MKERRTRKRNFVLLVLVFVLSYVPGCYYVGPPAPVVVTTPPPSSYDVAWDSALRAANEAGIQVTKADRSSGAIFGQRGSTSVNILVLTQSDGRTRVELNVRGAQQEASQISDQFYQAYERYMGRR